MNGILTTKTDLPRVYLNDSNWFRRLIDPLAAFSHGIEVVSKGYKMVTMFDRKRQLILQFPSGFFQIRFLDSWYVIVDRQHVKELLSAPDNVLSFTASAVRALQTEYTMAPDWATDIFHTPIVRTQLTQQIPKLTDKLVEELEIGFRESIPSVHGIHCFHSLAFIFNRLDTPCCL